MAGVLPRTGYLLTGYGGSIREFINLSEIAYFLGIYVSDKGCVTFRGLDVHPSYSMFSENRCSSTYGKGFTKEEVVKDWAREYMCKHLPREYKIYRYLL